MRSLSTIFWLATKELRSFFCDWVLVGLVVVAGLLVTVGSMSSTFNAQGAMSLMQDSQRMMLGILNNTVRSAGYSLDAAG